MTRQTDIDGYPTTCSRCGQPIVKSKEQGGLQFETNVRSGVRLAWHTRCPKQDA